MTTTIKRKPPLVPEWEKRLSKFLRDEGLIVADFTGRLELHIYQGGVSAVKREDILK